MSPVLAHTEAIQRIAGKYSLETAAIAAFIQVESDGDDLIEVVDIGVTKSLPQIRWEGHYFDKLVPAASQKNARDAKLASPKAGAIKNPASQQGRYELLWRACAIDELAAYQSISIGVGQVMGAHAVRLGFGNAKDMFLYAGAGFENQIDLMIRYLAAFNLIEEVQRHNFKGLARGYNGPGNVDAYAAKFEAAYLALSGTQPDVKTTGMLALGAVGREVRELQILLGRAGYALKVDGDYGPATRDVVKAYQKSMNIQIDGVVGPETMGALNALKVDPSEKIGTPDIKKTIDAVVIGVGGAGGLATAQGKIEAAATKAHGWGLDWVAQGMWVLAGILLFGGLAIGAYSFWKAHRS